MLKTARYWILLWASWIQFAHHFLFPKLSFLYCPFALLPLPTLLRDMTNDHITWVFQWQCNSFSFPHIPSISFSLIWFPNNIRRREQIMGLLIMQPAPYLLTSSILDANISDRIMFADILSPFCSSIGLQTPDLQVRIALYIIDFNNNIVRRQESCVNDGRRVRVLL
jgi:hypothetical protein